MQFALFIRLINYSLCPYEERRTHLDSKGFAMCYEVQMVTQKKDLTLILTAEILVTFKGYACGTNS